MKTLVSLFLLWAGVSQAACQFQASYKKIYSLSGPATELFEEWALLNSEQLKGVSIFYHLPASFKGERIPGGNFLSPAKLDEMKDALIFFDESQNLRKLFSTRNIKAIEIKTRNQSPREVAENVLVIVKKYVSGCDEKKIIEKVNKLEETIISRMKGKPSIVFFFGDVRNNHLPEYVIANDGLVLWLKQKKLITSYPSHLGYVNWSGSIIESMKKNSLFVGLKDEIKPSVVGDNKRVTLTYPGALLPGVKQLEAWSYFLDQRPR